ncbi:MAG: hypothetical protein K8T91_09030 [Planctomycetes bacterium]|nr:hypothetical protein [Planctomycetota bacterium]
MVTPRFSQSDGRRRLRRGAFSLAESLMAITLTSIAGGAILLGLASSAQTTRNVMDRGMATGMAAQLIDEALGCRYASVGAGAYQVGLGPNTYEMQGTGRERYDDVDDFEGVVSQPPKDEYGITLGLGNDAGGQRHPNFRLPSNYFSGWRQEVNVYYVSEANPSVRLTGSSTSNLRAVEVRIYRDDGTRGRELLDTVRRVVAYVPAPN